jgi:hypothetical protein
MRRVEMVKDWTSNILPINTHQKFRRLDCPLCSSARLVRRKFHSSMWYQNIRIKAVKCRNLQLNWFLRSDWLARSVKEHFSWHKYIVTRWGVTYRRVLDWTVGFIAPYTFTKFGTTGNYRAIAILHILQFTVAHALAFSVFTSRIQATDSSHSQCNFNSHMKSSLDSQIPFLPLLLNHLRMPSPDLDPSLFRLLFCTPCYSAVSTSPLLPNTSYNNFARTIRKTPSSVVNNACLLVRYLAIRVVARSKAWNVFALSNVGIVVSNPTQGMHDFLRLFCVCVVGSGLAKGWSPVQRVLPPILGFKNWSETKCFTDAICFKVGVTEERERERERE